MTKKPQINKFREKARELETDESERNFDDVLRKVARGIGQKQPSDKKSASRKKV